jgi:HK97 family phage portal protein
MTPFRAPDGTVAYRYQTEKGDSHTYLQGEILHIRDISDDGIVGISRIDEAREAFGLAMAMEQYGSGFFGNGASAGTVLEHPQKLSPEAYDRLKNSWEARHQGVQNAHKPAILEEGMKLAQLGIKPEDAQFLDSRKFQKDEIAMIFRVPPHMIASLDRATFSNIEHQSVEFVTFTLRPIMTRIEKAIYRDLLTTAGKLTHTAKFNAMALLRGDSTARANYYKAGLGTTQQPGWLTPNDVRELEDMNPVAGGDELTPLITSMKPAPGDEPPKDDGETIVANKASYRVSVPTVIEVQIPDRVVRKTITPTYDAGGDMLSAEVVEVETAQ